MAKFLQSQMGGRKLIYNGFGYTKKRENHEYITWKCDRQKSMKCVATVKTALDAVDGSEVEEFGRHIHERDPAKAEVLLAKQHLKRKAMESTSSITDVVSEVLGATGRIAAAGLPKESSLKRLAHHYRSGRGTDKSKRRGLRSANDGIMPEAESMIAARTISRRQPPAAAAIDRSPLPDSDHVIDAASHDDHNDMITIDDPTEVQILHDQAPNVHESPSTRLPSGLRTLPPVRVTSHGTAPGNGQKRREPSSTCGTMGVPVLHPLMRRKLEGDLRVQQKMESVLSKFDVTLDEMRRFVAEQRLVIRGVDVADMPIDIPNGMQVPGFLSEHPSAEDSPSRRPPRSGAAASSSFSTHVRSTSN